MTTKLACTTSSTVAVTAPEDWLDRTGVLAGSWEGFVGDAEVSVIANEISELGQGVALHQHDYAEVFVVLAGCVRFEVGALTVEASAGHIVVAPPNVPHSFVSCGSEPLSMIDIHQSAHFVTRWIDTPVS